MGFSTYADSLGRGRGSAWPARVITRRYARRAMGPMPLFFALRLSLLYALVRAGSSSAARLPRWLRFFSRLGPTFGPAFGPAFGPTFGPALAPPWALPLAPPWPREIIVQHTQV